MDKKEREEKQLIEWERVAAKQIKNTFADIKEIKFDKDSINKNKLTGYTGIVVEIVTENEDETIGISLPTDKTDEQITSSTGIGPKEGKTTNSVKVIFSDGKEDEL